MRYEGADRRMAGRSSTRREFLGLIGVSNLSRTNATSTEPDRPFLPTADVEWSIDTGEETTLLRMSETDGMLYVGTPTGASGLSTDGTQRWRRSIPSRGPDVPVAVYPGTGAVYVEGRRGVYALGATDGQTQWRYDGGEYAGIALVTAETVFLYEEGITAVAASDGRERWRFEPDDPIWIHPHFAGKYLYVGTIRGHLYSLDATTGRVDWHADYSSGNSSPRFWVAGSNHDTVFAWDSNGGELYGFDRDDGSLRWRFTANHDAVGVANVIRDDVAYIGDGRFVRAIAAADGTERWRYDVGSSVVRSPKFAGQTGYFGTAGGVHAVSTTDGTSRWRFSTGSDSSAYVASVSDGTVIVDSRGDAIYALDAERGRLQWQFEYDGRSGWLSRVADDTVYLSTGSGTVYALSDPGLTPLYDAYRTVSSPAGILVGGLVGGALTAGAYRRYVREDSEPVERTTVEAFELRDAIAETDYSTVYEARTPGDGQVALKRLTEGTIASEEFSEAVETWADLDVPGVLEVREWGTDPVPWVVTELADASLTDCVDDLTPERLVRVLADTAETVHRAHREGVVHGRIAPGNVLFVNGDVRVGDWQLAAKLRGSTDRSDLSQLAAMADDLLGNDRFTTERRPDELDDVLSRALAADPADRYDSALKFADALRWAVRE